MTKSEVIEAGCSPCETARAAKHAILGPWLGRGAVVLLGGDKVMLGVVSRDVKYCPSSERQLPSTPVLDIRGVPPAQSDMLHRLLGHWGSELSVAELSGVPQATDLHRKRWFHLRRRLELEGTLWPLLSDRRLAKIRYYKFTDPKEPLTISSDQLEGLALPFTVDLSRSAFSPDREDRKSSNCMKGVKPRAKASAVAYILGATSEFPASICGDIPTAQAAIREAIDDKRYHYSLEAAIRATKVSSAGHS